MTEIQSPEISHIRLSLYQGLIPVGGWYTVVWVSHPAVHYFTAPPASESVILTQSAFEMLSTETQPPDVDFTDDDNVCRTVARTRRSGVGLAAGAGAIAGAVAAPAAAMAAIAAMGFTEAGIAAGSAAAVMMSVEALATGGGVAAGGAVATLQSVGVVGLSIWRQQPESPAQARWWVQSLWGGSRFLFGLACALSASSRAAAME